MQCILMAHGFKDRLRDRFTAFTVKKKVCTCNLMNLVLELLKVVAIYCIIEESRNYVTFIILFHLKSRQVGRSLII